jgi:hypothetical protein
MKQGAVVKMIHGDDFFPVNRLRVYVPAMKPGRGCYAK